MSGVESSEPGLRKEEHNTYFRFRVELEPFLHFAQTLFNMIAVTIRLKIPGTEAAGINYHHY